MIYKICSREAWQEAERQGQFYGAEIDLRDGYIHFSAAHQVRETAAKHFPGQTDLLLVTVDEAALGENLRWEVSRGGDRFPHLYGALRTEFAVDVSDLPLGPTGCHVFPKLVE